MSSNAQCREANTPLDKAPISRSKPTLKTQFADHEPFATLEKPEGRRIGYARISCRSQSLEAQVLMLKRAGCSTIYKETGSGARRKRPVLGHLLDSLAEGDTLVVCRLDRLGRSLRNLIEIVDLLSEREVGLQSLKEAIDTTTSAGRLIFHIFGSLAEFERELIRERTIDGLTAARERGAKPGRKRLLTDEQIAHVRDGATAGRSIKSLGEEFGVSRATIYRVLAGELPVSG